MANSCLNLLDEINFSDDKIESYYDFAIKFVYDHFESSVEKEVVSIEDTTPSINNMVDNNNSSEMNHQEKHKRFLYEKAKARKQSRNKSGPDSELSLDKKKLDLLKKIKSKMKDYREECGELNVATWLNEHGNDLYHSLKEKKNGIDYIKINEHDVIYISKFFDVLEWWKIKESTYPELAVGACIVLGKPTHNAFQERVFSRDTYNDSKLRKQLKE
ncbi:MAG: hAT transposon family protein, partial [Lactococcus lactis]